MLKDFARTDEADVCLLLEATFPYVPGGVSSWVNDLIRAQAPLTFHVFVIMPDHHGPDRRGWKPAYDLPDNLVGLTHMVLQDLPAGNAGFDGRGWSGRGRRLLQALEKPLLMLHQDGGAAEIEALRRLIEPARGWAGRRLLLDSGEAWKLLTRMYLAEMPRSSFLDYFWTWRGIHSGLLHCLQKSLPRARCYHTVSTGYAGLLAARARVETGRPAIVTEHGIYTNERRLEINSADWLYENAALGLTVTDRERDLRDIWISCFVAMSRACYAACDHIITLHRGNQELQRTDGARDERMRVVPNGIDFERFAAIPTDPGPRPPQVALIGRVVPIKDVKTFIRAIGILSQSIPELRAYVIGPEDEDRPYAEECKTMVRGLGLENTLVFTGRQRIDEWMGRLDAVVLTSLSESQPLTILEAGAAGVPTVATDVGACREMILGPPDENPPLGPGGEVTPLANPTATAAALRRILTSPDWRAKLSHNIRARVRQYYYKPDVVAIYRDLYQDAIARPDAPPPLLGPEPAARYGEAA